MKTMKKAIALLLALFTLASLCACGNLEGTVVEPASDTEVAGESGNTVKTPTPEDETNETAPVDDYDVELVYDEDGEVSAVRITDSGEDNTENAGEPAKAGVTNIPVLSDDIDTRDTVAIVVKDLIATPYKSMIEAWQAANSSVDRYATMILLTDWIAEDGIFGTGEGFEKNGNLCPKDRTREDIPLVLDLNGHTIDRNLKEPRESGNIISLKKDGTFIIKNGTMTGGNTSDRGSAIWMDNDETTVYLDNLTITGNYAKGNGGAIFCRESTNDLYINNTTITDNTSENYGGAIYVQYEGSYTEMHLSGTVVIKDNHGKDKKNNICLQWVKDKESFLISVIGSLISPPYVGADIGDVMDLEEGSMIFVSTSNGKSAKVITDSLKVGGLYSVYEFFRCDNKSCHLNYSRDEDSHEAYMMCVED